MLNRFPVDFSQTKPHIPDVSNANVTSVNQSRQFTFKLAQNEGEGYIRRREPLQEYIYNLS